jgi:hypothetical protein
MRLCPDVLASSALLPPTMCTHLPAGTVFSFLLQHSGLPTGYAVPLSDPFGGELEKVVGTEKTPATTEGAKQ